jgi:Domain of unknown function (DUF4160)
MIARVVTQVQTASIVEKRETNEPPHIHVSSARGLALFWLSPVEYRDSWGYTPREIGRIRRIVTANREELLRRCNEYFDA